MQCAVTASTPWPAAFTLAGIGLHTGEHHIDRQPADPDHGYVFQRMDLDGQPRIPADCRPARETRRGTTLEKGNARVHTTEHLLAALHGCGIDNALIEMEGPEVPILDGSSWPFVAHIEEVGAVEQDADRHFLTLSEPMTYRSENGVEILAVPPTDNEYRVTVMVDYGSPVLGTQHASMRDLDHFTSDVSRCRTFVFLKEVKTLLEQGLIKGGDLENAIVLAERTYSEEGLPPSPNLWSARRASPWSPARSASPTTPPCNTPTSLPGTACWISRLPALTGCLLRGHILAARPGQGRQCGIRPQAEADAPRLEPRAPLRPHRGAPVRHPRHRTALAAPLPFLLDGKSSRATRTASSA